MNTVALFLLVFLLAETLFEFFSEWLNLRASRQPLPDAFRDVYSTEKYARSQDYLREKTQLGWISGSVDLVLFLVFWLLGGFNSVDQFIRSFGFSSIVNGLLFFGALSVLKGLFSLPFGLYNTFILEEKYGFNRTTWKTWLVDAAKGLALSLVIGIPLGAALLWFFESAGSYGWLIAFGVVSAFSLLMQYIAPTWIMPLFNTFTPLPDGELRQEIMRMAEKAAFPLQNVFVMDGSKRSAHSNAFFSGFGKNKRIVLYDTLVEKHSVPELVAVLAHEIGHYEKKHVLKGTVISMAHTAVLFFLLSLFLSWTPLFDAFFMEKTSVYAGLLFFGMLFSPIELVLGVLLNKLSRRHEFEADAFAREQLGTGEPLISGLKKLSADNLSNLTPHPMYVALHYSHPPVLERMNALRSQG